MHHKRLTMRANRKAAVSDSGPQLRAADGNVGCFHQREDFVARHKVHFLDRARGDNRRDLSDARLNDYFTRHFVGHDAFHTSRELVSDAFFHSAKIAQIKSDVSDTRGRQHGARALCIASGLRSINFPAMPDGEQAGYRL